MSEAQHAQFSTAPVRPQRFRSRITSTVDLERNGKQFGFLSIPHSTDSSAWGSIRMPIVVLRNGDGPTVLFTAGNHGDEYEGPIALLKLVHELDPASITGRIIVLPALNFPAVRAGTRLSPIDGRNMNRVFPGNRNGGVTEMIAHYVHEELLPHADAVVDIHSGGRTLDFIPNAVMHHLEDAELMKRTMELLVAFSAPVSLVLVELDSEGMLDTAVEDMGKLFLSTELGGGGTTTTETVAIADRGVRNVLAHLGVIDEPVVHRDDLGLSPTRLMHTPDGSCFVPAPETGIYETLVDVGDEVEEGMSIARIHFFDNPEREPVVLTAARDGMLICRHFPARISAGDCAAVIACDYPQG